MGSGPLGFAVSSSFYLVLLAPSFLFFIMPGGFNSVWRVAEQQRYTPVLFSCALGVGYPEITLSLVRLGLDLLRLIC